MNKIKNNSIYFDQLNGIRFVAVFLVLVDHWFAEKLPIPLGHLGVVIFFVLSGFLITRILFLNAEDCRKNNQSYVLKIKNFIIRRSLRIFPIYFFICLIGLILNISPIRDNWIWMLTYTPNWYIIFYQQWMGVWDHLWSLAVEEQYYLVFPYFILFLNPARYRILFMLMIIIGVFSRIIFFTQNSPTFLEENWQINYVNPLTAIDCFGLGGILAFIFNYKNQFIYKFKKIHLLITLILSISILIFNQTFELKHASFSFLVFERSFFALFAFCFISIAIQANKDWLSAFLENKVISYLGKISYGLYLYHNFVYNVYHNNGNTLFGYFDRKLEISKYLIFQNQYSLFFINFITLIVFSTISWFLIEKPINSFKTKFE